MHREAKLAKHRDRQQLDISGTEMAFPLSTASGARRTFPRVAIGLWVTYLLQEKR